jgi:hypothetical protein
MGVNEPSLEGIFVFVSLSKLPKKMRFPSWPIKSEIIFCRLFRQSGPESSKLRFGFDWEASK